LPGGLKIEEYKIANDKEIYSIESLVAARHPDQGGWYFWPQGGMIDRELFQAVVVKTSDGAHSQIHAELGNKTIFIVDCDQVITAWTYKNHWIIQGHCWGEPDTFEIYWDGTSLNASKGYQSSFAFQLIGGEPFYLFKKDGQVWLSYGDEVSILGYDDVKLTYCCETYHPPQHYENRIAFYAEKNGQLYFVTIGRFAK
jgi:hypothetical protein